jgi:hypothetical protein
MLPRLCFLVLALAISMGIAVPTSAQVQTGTLTGVVKDPDGLPVPGATIIATSRAMQGQRTVVSDEVGAYILRGLPPGTYTVRFEMGEMKPVEQTIDVPLGAPVRLDATMALGGIQEEVTVAGESTPAALSSTQVSANYRAELVNALPVGRTPSQIAYLAPGVTDNTPNAGQIAIGGGFGFDSIFLIDGVDTNDNLFGSTNNLFIEDSIAETQVLTSGISAEYGRFGGGVVNVVTKSGGNRFSGSFRTNFSRPSWTEETPFEKERNQTRAEDLSKFFEGTIGGPIVRDRLWFFNGNRYQDSATTLNLSEIGTAYTNGVNNKRFELKITGTPITNHTVSLGYLNSPTNQTNQPSINSTFSSDPRTLVNRELPNNRWVANWQGVLTSSLFATFQYSRKDFGFRGAGGTSDAITDSPMLSRGILQGVTPTRHYNAPYFSANDPEDRNNRQYAGSLSYHFTGGGRHDLKGGFEHFKSYRTGGNSQTATGYVFTTDYLVDAAGRPVVVNGGLTPVFRGNAANPAAAPSRVENWLSVPGSQIDINTLSLYVQDRWAVNPHLTVDLGLRWEKVRSEATGDIIGADTDAIMPRLGATFDPRGNGRTVFQATYGVYSGRYTERAFARNTTVGTPSLVLLGYTGPDGQGTDFAPGFDINNYVVLGGNFPTANTFLDDGLQSPRTNEFTLGVGQQFGVNNYVKLLYVWRETDNFIEAFVDDPTATGKIDVVFQGRNFGRLDRVLYRNTDVPIREYQALQLMSRAQFTDTLWLEGSWTVQIKNHGDFEGEAANQPGNADLFHTYPEILSVDRHFPYGRLNEFQRHKFRLWTVYTQGLGRFGSVDVAPMWRVNSGLTYSHSATIAHTATMLARNPGYLRTASPGGTSAVVYFGERGSEDFKGYGLFDLAFNYGIPLWQEIRPWVNFQIFNVFNNDKLIQWNTTVTGNSAGPVDSNGLPTEFVRAGTYGQATSAAHFPAWAPGETGGRTYRVAFGVRF